MKDYIEQYEAPADSEIDNNWDGVIPAMKRAKKQEVSFEEKAWAAAKKLSGGRRDVRIRIADLKDMVGRDIDQIVIKWVQEEKAVLTPYETKKTVSQRDMDAAIVYGLEKNVWLYVE